MTHWHDCRTLGITGGRGSHGGHPFDRLPYAAEAALPPIVWELSQQSAGMHVDFRSDAVELQARCMLRQAPLPEHLYIKYLDLYSRDTCGHWRWAASNLYGFFPSGVTPLVEGLTPGEWRTWRLYLPLTYSVGNLEIGVPSGGHVEPIASDETLPIVIYGTSIVHGCAHVIRPGMAWPSIVGRHLDRTAVNLGFSGSARMEFALADFIADQEAGAYVIDPLANMGIEQVESHAEPFLRRLNERRQATPILLMDDRTHANAWLFPHYYPPQIAKQRSFEKIANTLKSEGMPISYLSGADLIGVDSEGTTDGSHPSDLGAMRYAHVVTPVAGVAARAGESLKMTSHIQQIKFFSTRTL